MWLVVTLSTSSTDLTNECLHFFIVVWNNDLIIIFLQFQQMFLV